MRVSIVSILLAGGMLALGACASTGSAPMTLAERTEQCRNGAVVPTGRQTGDARSDYDCQGRHAVDRHDHGDRNDVRGSQARSSAVDRAIRGE